MTFEAALVAFIEAQVPELQDRFGPPPIGETPEFPCATYFRLSPGGVGVEYSHSGSSNLVHPRFQIDVWHTLIDEMERVAELVVNALSGFKGTMSGIPVGASFLNDPGTDFYEPDTQRYRRMLDFEFWYSDAV